MKLKQLFADEDAVSPVIGVILMVAITVILAAVIGTFVLGLGNQVSSTTPSATFTVDFHDMTADGVNFTHDGGDKIPAAQLALNSDTGYCNGAGNKTAAACTDTARKWSGFSSVSGDTVTAGDTASIRSTNDLSAATIRIIWTSESGDSSATLRKWSGPNA